MTKKAAISGVLPRPRLILPKRKTFFEKQAEEKAKQVFQTPEMVPKNVAEDWHPKHEKGADERIARSAKDPSKARKENSDQQKWKNMTADMRRSYFKTALKKQDASDQTMLERREQRYQEARKARLEMGKHDESEATRLTLPTIDSFLHGPFIQPRTAEEKEQLLLKRKANRLHHQVKHKQQKAVGVLELYQQAGEFITDEQELDTVVDRVFTVLKDTKPPTFLETDPGHQAKVARDMLAQKLLGNTSNDEPGLPKVEKALGGESGV